MPYNTDPQLSPNTVCNDKPATEIAYDELIRETEGRARNHLNTANAMANLVDSGSAYPSEIPKAVDKRRNIARIQQEVISALKQMKLDALSDLKSS